WDPPVARYGIGHAQGLLIQAPALSGHRSRVIDVLRIRSIPHILAQPRENPSPIPQPAGRRLHGRYRGCAATYPSRGLSRRLQPDNEPPRSWQDYLSVNFNSIRRLRRYASSLSAGSSGWLSANPAAASRAAGTPCATA